MTDLQKAKTALDQGGYTCVLCRGEQVLTSSQRGVRPLAAWYAAKEDFSGFSAADKVVGKATAFLYVLLKVSHVYARVLSRSALQVLHGNGISVEYDTLTEHIINRQGTGVCPFEAAVLETVDPTTAYALIREKMTELGIEI